MIQSNLKGIFTGPTSLLGWIFLFALATRLLAVKALVTVDEVTWLTRGLIFVKNLAELNLIGTYVKYHPGVTLMWLDGISFIIHWTAQHILSDPLYISLSSLTNDIETLREQKDYSLSLYVLTRTLQALITSGCVAILFLQARKLLGLSIASLGIGLLLFEPFFLGYQRLLLTDVLQADLLILSLVSLLLYLRDDSNFRLLLVSGGIMGLATATKVTALFAVPAITVWIVLIELGVWQARFPQRGWRTQIKDMAIWGMIALVTIFLIWPALWVSPGYVFSRMITGLQGETERGLFFFLGQTTDSVGLLFYPVVLLYRLSPLLLIGTVIGLLMLMLPRFRQRLACAPELTALTLANLSILLVFSISGNKLDRYILAAIPGFAFLAAAGWLQIAQAFSSVSRGTFQSQPTNSKPLTQPGMKSWGKNAILSLTAIQFTLMAIHSPYYLTYFNPLLGGGKTAQNVLMIGNGEGLDRAAEWLNQLPEAEKLTVGSAYGTAFISYFQGQTLNVRRGVEELQEDWLQKVNYLVFYINQFQRQLPSPEILNYFTAQEPLHTVRLHGVDYVKIYPGSAVLPEQLSQIQVTKDLLFEDTLRLRGYDIQQPMQAGQISNITLYWEILKPPQRKVSISLRLQGDNQRWKKSEPLMQALLPRNQMVPGLIIRDVHQIALPDDMPAGNYVFQIGYNEGSQQKVDQFEVKKS